MRCGWLVDRRAVIGTIVLGLFSRRKVEETRLPPSSAFIRCPACGKVVHRTIARCPYCSAFLEVQCPNCDRTTNRAFSRCPYCDADLRQAKR